MFYVKNNGLKEGKMKYHFDEKLMPVGKSALSLLFALADLCAYTFMVLGELIRGWISQQRGVR